MPQPPAHMYPPHPHYIPQHHPLMNIPIPPSILKKTSAYATSSSIPTLAPNKEPPGVPPFPPPDLSSDDEDTSEKVFKFIQNQLMYIFYFYIYIIFIILYNILYIYIIK